jgi:hypothetical protein
MGNTLEYKGLGTLAPQTYMVLKKYNQLRASSLNLKSACMKQVIKKSDVNP